MSTEDQPRSAELRVGGWVPPYHEAAGTTPLPGAFLASATAAVPGPGHPSGAALTGRRRAAIVACAALAVLLVTGLVAYQTGRTARPGPPRFVALPVVPTVPALPLAPPPGSPSVSVSAAAQHSQAARRPSSSASSSPASASPAPSRARPAKPAPQRRGPFTLGRAVGLEPAGMPGHRVRHRDYRGRVDRIDATSPALDRADSTFTVRAGLAGPGCVSFESVNYPGHFLRHRDSRIWLDRRDATDLYAADATFCPEEGQRGGTVLRSQNYPDRFVSLRRSRLDLGGWPVAFTVRGPL